MIYRINKWLVIIIAANKEIDLREKLIRIIMELVGCPSLIRHVHVRGVR